MNHPVTPSSAGTSRRGQASFPVWRYLVAAGAVLTLGAVVLARLAMLQLGPDRRLWADLQPSTYSEYVYIPRGLIYDRNGHLLAGDVLGYEVDLNLALVPKAELSRVARDLAAVLRMDPAQVEVHLQEAQAKADAGRGPVLIRLVPYVSDEQKDALEQMASSWFYLNAKGKRVSFRGALQMYRTARRAHPAGDLAANVLGIVSEWDGKGHYGVEGYYEGVLRARRGWFRRPFAPWSAAGDRHLRKSPATLYLTIDSALQAAAEEEARRALENTKSESAVIIVANPHTGEILAMAVAPRPTDDDRDAALAYKAKYQGFNLAIEKPYEPGSVFKVITMAAAIDAGVVTPDTVYHDTGVYKVSGRGIPNWDRGAWGDQTMVGCLGYSLNTCLAAVAHDKLGKKRFYTYLAAFGFGRESGVDLAEEQPGGYRHDFGQYSDGWTDYDLAAQGFGQAILVNPVQMVAALSVVANGGYLITPHVLKYEIEEGRTYPYHPQVQQQVISAEAARTMRQMLHEALPMETKTALVPGYSVAGKTGTAQIAVPGQGYSWSVTNASFGGWFPADDPQYVIYIWLQRPRTSPWASVVAAPVFAEMVKRVAVLEKVPPDDVRAKLQPPAQP